MRINPPVFLISAGLIAAFVLFGALFAETAGRLFDTLQSAIIVDFGWLYVVAVAGFLVFVLFLMFSRYGDVKLGPDDSEPEYSYLSWFAMLFSAGMGIGLLFFGVAEPLQHYAAPPVGEGRSIEAARQAMVLTFFHWGLHAWAIYIVVGLALAYFAFRRGLPLTIRSALFPLIGRRIHGPIGHAVDIFAVLGTMFGVATSLGFGVLQVNAGFHHLFGLPDTQIEILVDPQSVIHSMVAYRDGSVLAQLGSPGMRTPIAYALGWPKRIAPPADRLDFSKVRQLTFEAPDETRFPALRIARETLRAGGGASSVLNAANEVAVAAFLGRQIRFTDIAAIAEQVLSELPGGQIERLDQGLALDAEARRRAADAVASRRRNTTD